MLLKIVETTNNVAKLCDAFMVIPATIFILNKWLLELLFTLFHRISFCVYTRYASL